MQSRMGLMIVHTIEGHGDRTFAAAGSRLWNSLPVRLRDPDITYGLFTRQLKVHLFSGCMSTALWRSVTSSMWHLRKTFTYLHTLCMSTCTMNVLLLFKNELTLNKLESKRN